MRDARTARSILKATVSLVVAAAAFAALGPASPASTRAEAVDFPGTPFTLVGAKNVSGATVGVDASGTGHFAWIEHAAVGKDVLRYCRVPRGAKGCQGAKTFPLGNKAFAAQQVLVTGQRVVIAASSCCFNDTSTGAHLLAVVSENGGKTFAEPTLVGTYQPSGRAVLGPGDDQISVATGADSQGVRFQAAPLDRMTTGSANLGEGFGAGRWYDGSIGYVAATVPIVAVSDLHKLYWREWGGKGDYNDVATWGKTQPLGPGVEPLLAGGSRGVYLLSALNRPGKDQYVVRRFDAVKHSFGAASPVSNVGDPIFRDFVQDAGGHLQAVWIDNGKGDPLRYRVSSDGKTWGPIETLVPKTNDGAYNLRVGAGPDGGGWVVWDGNGKGPIRAVAFPAPAKSGGGGGGPGCLDEVSLGIGVARTTVGCFKKEGGSYTSTEPVRLNGIDLLPVGGTKIALTPGSRTIVAKGNVTVKAGNVVLDKGPISWTVPASPTSTPVAEFPDIGKFNVELLGFDVVGKASLVLEKSTAGAPGASVPVNLKLPAPFSDATAGAVLRTNNATSLGLILQGTALDAPEAFVGPLLVKSLHVGYQGGKLFEGKARFLLPPFYSEPGVAVSFGFDNGKFKHAEGTVTFQPPLPLAPPFASLNAVGVALSASPLKLTGGVEILAGPPVLGKAAVRITALPQSGLSFELGDPAVLRATGKLAVVEIPFANGFVEYRTNGVLTFGGGLAWGVPNLVDLTAGIPPGGGFVDLKSGAFMGKALGKGSLIGLPVGSAEVVLSSKGAGACLETTIGKSPFAVTVHARAGAKWGQIPVVTPGLSSCDLGAYEVTKTAGRMLSVAQARRFVLPAGLEQATVALTGTTGPPLVTVKGPGGVSLSSAADGAPQVAHKGAVALYSSAGARTTYLMLAKPKAGTYTVTEKAGSPAIKNARIAQGLPAVQVTAKVTGTGGKRLLAYTASALGGRTVELYERARGAFSRLGAVKGPKGTIAFVPAPGPAGRREIVALTSIGGIPSGQRVIATYVASRSAAPGRPALPRVVRRGVSLSVTWAPVANATRYAIRARLDDGRRLLFVRPPTKRNVRIAGLRASTKGTVTVQALGPDGRPGPAATVAVGRTR